MSHSSVGQLFTVGCNGADEEVVTHVTAFAAAKPPSTSTPLLRRELGPSEALTTRPWVLSGPTFQRARPEALSTGWLRVTLAPRAAMAPRKPLVSRLELPGLIVVLPGSCVPGRGTRHREPSGRR
jgi:hypothetical protein